MNGKLPPDTATAVQPDFAGISTAIEGFTGPLVKFAKSVKGATTQAQADPTTLSMFDGALTQVTGHTG